MSNKNDTFKEQFKHALISTAKVISDDYKIDSKKNDKEFTSKNNKIIDIANLSNKNDFIKLRAETDSDAVKKNFLTHQYLIKIYQKINPVNLFTK
jgi:cobaltochelatase CobT